MKDETKILLMSHILIRDKDTGEIFLKKSDNEKVKNDAK